MTSATQATVVAAPIVVRTAMIAASDSAAFRAPIEGRRVLSCLVENTTCATSHEIFSVGFLYVRDPEQVCFVGRRKPGNANAPIE